MSASGRGALRREADFYPTPTEAILPILDRILWERVGLAFEPCRGDGAIYDLVCERAVATDWCELSEGRDYLASHCEDVDLIITNPPFSLAMEFLKKSLHESGTVVYLLRLNFLGSQKRRLFWQTCKPTHLYVLSKRPSFTGHGTDATEYAWFCWDDSEVIIDPPGIYAL